jgi:hypothetical protein
MACATLAFSTAPVEPPISRARPHGHATAATAPVIHIAAPNPMAVIGSHCDLETTDIGIQLLIGFETVSRPETTATQGDEPHSFRADICVPTHRQPGRRFAHFVHRVGPSVCGQLWRVATTGPVRRLPIVAALLNRPS